jgi:hypothetical protein
VIDLDRLALLGRSGNDTELIGQFLIVLESGASSAGFGHQVKNTFRDSRALRAAASLSIFSSATRNWLRALAVGFDVTNVTSHVLQSIDQKSSPSF